MIEALAHRGLGDAKSEEPLLELTASEQKLTYAAISSAVRGTCNASNIEVLHLTKVIVLPPQSRMNTEFRGAPDYAYAPTPGPNHETVTSDGL